MNLSPLRPSFVLTAVLAITGVPVSAQVTTGNYHLNYGVSEFGGSVLALGYSRLSDCNPGIELASGNTFIQRIRAFGTNVEASAVLTNYSVRKVSTGLRSPMYDQTATASFVRRIAGLTWSTSATSNATIEAVCSPGLAFGSAGAAHNVNVYGLSIGVRVNASVGLSYGLTPNLTFDPVPMVSPLGPRLTAGLSGFARGSAVGTASAWLAVPVPLATVGAGVSANLVFADTRIDLSAIATTTTRGGALVVSVRPITLRLDAIARVTTMLGTVEHRERVVDWSAGTVHQVLPLQ